MKKYLFILSIVVLVAFGLFTISRILMDREVDSSSTFETETIRRGAFSSMVEVNGVVQPSQSALLFWKISGEVKDVNVRPGDRVSSGETLATLETTSLPPSIIVAQAELINTQKTLDDLLYSKMQQAQALKTLDDAQYALDESFNPETIQAMALLKVAEAEGAVVEAQRKYVMITTPVSQFAIDQAYANLLLAKNKMEDTEKLLQRLQNDVIVSGPSADLIPAWIVKNAKHEIRRLTKQVDLLFAQDKLAYEKSLNRYNSLLEPPDPIEVAAAEAELVSAKARLAESQREWERIKDGYSPAEVAVLEAELADAQRALERVKDGPNPDDIAILQTQITAAKAVVSQMKIGAPFDGTVMVVRSQAHDRVDSGSLAFRLDDLSHLYIDLSVSEIDVKRIEIGQKAMLTFDSIPNEEYQGKVIEMAMVGQEVMGETNFKVKVELINPDKNIRPGMTTLVKIIVNEAENVLLVPSQAIRTLNGATVVYLVQEPSLNSSPSSPGRGQNSKPEVRFQVPFFSQRSVQNQIKPVVITLGTTSSNYSEIISGDVQAGDIVVLNPPNEGLGN